MKHACYVCGDWDSEDEDRYRSISYRIDHDAAVCLKVLKRSDGRMKLYASANSTDLDDWWHVDTCMPMDYCPKCGRKLVGE